ncbi:MAG: hypothetical protein JJT77_02440 [Crocinitomicaceae bacterium]|nr:hypothetical protein [Crocinitomicaceae bacterium]
MAKTASTDLYDLIQRMTKSEKRYFKVFSSRHTIGKSNNYVALFDFIEKMETYDETTIFEAFEGQDLLNQFPTTKIRLYDAVLKALDAYHANHMESAAIYKLLNSVQILFDKGLFSQAKKNLHAAEKLVNKYHRNDLLPACYHLQRMVLEKESNCHNQEEMISSLAHEENATYEELKAIGTLWREKQQLLLFIQKMKRPFSQEEMQKLMDFHRAIVQKKKALPRSFMGKFLYYQSLAAYHYAKNEPQEILNCMLAQLKLFDDFKSSKQQFSQQYFSLQANLIQTYVQLGQTKKAMPYLNELLAMEKDLAQLPIFAQQQYFVAQMSSALMLYVNAGQFEKAVRYRETVIEGLEKFSFHNNISNLQYICFKLGIAFFALADHKESLRWINEIVLKTKLEEGNKSLFLYAELLQLINHYELGHQDYLPYAIQNTWKQFIKHGLNEPFESLVIGSLRSLLKCDDHLAAEEQLLIIVRQTEALPNAAKARALSFFDFTCWMQSKIKQQPFHALSIQKYFSQKRAKSV